MWSEALTAEGRNSPDDDLEAIRKVTLADVNRVAKQYLVSSNSITATLKPSPSGEAVAAKGFGGGEKMTSAPTKPVVLPAWAASVAVPAESSRRLHRRVGFDPAQRSAPDCEVRPHQPNRNRRGYG